MALALSCLRPLGLLPRNIRISSLTLSCLVQQRLDLWVVEHTFALTNVGVLFMYSPPSTETLLLFSPRTATGH